MSWKDAWVVLFGIIVVAAGLRFTGLGNNSFVADEFLDINSAYGFRQTGEWRAWDFNFGKPAEMNMNVARDERAFVYKWQVATLLDVLPPTEAVARTVSVLWGLLSVFLAFGVTYRATRRKEIGLVASALVAISVSALIFDRRLRMYAMFAPVYLAFLWTLFEWLEGETTRYDRGFLKMLNEKTAMQWLWFIPTVFLGALAFVTHFLSVNFVPVLGLYLFVMAVKKWRAGEGWKHKYASLIGTGIVGVAIVALVQPKIIGAVLASFTFFDDHYSYFGYVAMNFWHPLVGFLLMGLGGWYLSLKLERSKPALFLSLAFWTPLLMAVFFWNRNEGPQYIYFVQSFGIILASIGLFGLFEFIRRALGTQSSKTLVLTGLLLALIVPNWAYFFRENNTYHETSSSSNPNYRKVFQFVMKEKQATDVLVTRNFRNYYWSGAKLPVFDFGGELSTKAERLSVDKLVALKAQYSTGWVILSGNDLDYVTNEAEDLLDKEFTRVSNSNVRGDIFVYRWGTSGLQ